MASEDTNQLLREIRDILAPQQNKYEQHLKDVRTIYAEQIQTNAAERKKSVRILFAAILVVVGGVTLAIMTFSK
jgi:hypothetical protein